MLKGTEKTRRSSRNDKLQLTLHDRCDGLLECRRRIQGDYASYLPETHPFTEKMSIQSHLATLHGGVALTMTKTKVKTTGAKRHKELLWVQTFPGNSIDKATTWKLTKKLDRGNNSVSSSWC